VTEKVTICGVEYTLGLPKVHVAAAHVPDGWYACEYPERPPDPHTLFGVSCRRCLIAEAAAIQAGLHAPFIQVTWNTGESLGLMTADEWLRDAFPQLMEHAR
jgi:hypothetical protein